ncbi:hypothetical protein LRAMOSA07257 [Lichtheimia ramosa]|uniref:LisH domain-containing protein n=1 Tax=Lichtheimia ramosa TaxID=688394 RepID=A0A077WDL5_9FUNG|nr:hypothetical protein LRAMOSA07257 [Lichtheimia ramosa]
MGDRIHTAILQFLLTHGYKETQEAFVKEAGEFIDFESVEDVPPLDGTFSDALNQVTRNVASMSLERQEDFEDADGDYYSTLVEQYGTIHTANVLAVAVDPHSRCIATSSTDRTVKLTNSTTGVILREYRHHQAPVLSIAFHPSQANLMLTTSMDGTAVLADTSKSDDMDPSIGVVQRFKDHQKYIVQGLFSPVDGRYMATASYDRTVCIYEQDQEGSGHYRLIKQLGPFLGNVETICFADNAVLVIGVRDDNYLHYIHLQDGFKDQKCNMNANNDDWVSFAPAYLSVSPDGRYLLCSTDHSSGRIILFKKGESTQVRNYYDMPSDNQFATRRHCWHPSGHYFYISGADDHCIRVLETKTGRVATTLKGGHTAMVRALSVDTNVGLVSVGYDHQVNIWSQPAMSIVR